MPHGTCEKGTDYLLKIVLCLVRQVGAALINAENAEEQ